MPELYTVACDRKIGSFSSGTRFYTNIVAKLYREIVARKQALKNNTANLTR
jgi:hypothetical protein